MHVANIVMVIRQGCHFEVMSGEQGKGLNAVSQMRGGGPGQRQAVKGAGTTAHLVHQHQTVGGRIVQDIRSFGHFHHKGRPSARNVIGTAHTSENTINWPDYRTFSWHVAANVSQQGNNRYLPHIGRFTAHVRAGDDLHALLLIEVCVVGDKGIGDQSFHHGMAALLNVKQRVINQLWSNKAQRLSAFCQVGDDIQFGQCRR